MRKRDPVQQDLEGGQKQHAAQGRWRSSETRKGDPTPGSPEVTTLGLQMISMELVFLETEMQLYGLHPAALRRGRRDLAIGQPIGCSFLASAITRCSNELTRCRPAGRQRALGRGVRRRPSASR
jgi:hypothetical protein